MSCDNPTASANVDDGNGSVAENAVDGLFNTRWSGESDNGEAILQLDCGDQAEIAGLQIAFYRGDERVTSFLLEGSADAISWEPLSPSLSSSGQSESLEYFALSSVAQVRYLRYLGFGNSTSAWNSITEVRVLSSGEPEPTPSPIASPTPAPSPVQPTPTPALPTPTPSAEPTPSATPSPQPSVEPLPPSELDTVPDIACTVEVANTSDLENNTGYGMSAGTTVCLLDGTYTDVELEIGGDGTETQPITVTAKNPGSVFIEGESQVRMMGTHVVVQGLVFRNGNSASSDLFQTRGQGNTPCNYCRITEITIIDWDKTFENSNRWFLIFGQHNRIDHSYFSGKTTRGALLTIDRGELTEPDYAQIDHNYFGDRLPFSGGEFPDGSDNEFEGIRIGTSDTQAFPSYSRVEYNYMERMRGEAEVISNKSGSNVISHNTIRSSYGGLVNRHGSGSVISNNFIFADGYGMSGGIRISGADHEVVNNYIDGCTFSGSSFNGGIVLTRTDGDQATSGYQQVDNVLIAHNTIINCIDSIKLDGGRSSSSTLPTNVYLVNNVVANADGPIFLGDIPPSTSFAGNYFGGDSLGLDTELDGITFGDPLFGQMSDGLFRPSPGSPVIAGGVNDYAGFPTVTSDMDGQTRTNPDAGADEVSDETVTSRPLTRGDVGPINYQP